jgi:hypothetical protein
MTGWTGLGTGGCGLSAGAGGRWIRVGGNGLAGVGSVATGSDTMGECNMPK